MSSLFVPNPLVKGYASGSLRDAGVITLVGGSSTGVSSLTPNAGSVVVAPGAQLLLKGSSATIETPEFAASSGGPRFVKETIWSNGGLLQIAGGNVYFAGTVDAAGGAPQAAGGALAIGDVVDPSALPDEQPNRNRNTGNLAAP